MKTEQKTDIANLRLRPRLYYRSTCPRCRGISRLIVCLSLGFVQRVPMSSAEACRIYASHGQQQGRPAIFYQGHFATGWRMVSCIGAAVLNLPVTASRSRWRPAPPVGLEERP